MKALTVLILAAGQGTRMKSALPKVIHPAAGRPILEHVLSTVRALKPSGVGLILGHGRKQVEETLARHGWSSFRTILQSHPRGSGHAVKMAASWLRSRSGTLLVVYGDTPLLTAGTLSYLVQAHRASDRAATFLAMDVPNPAGYGRMIVNRQGLLERIIEDRDASALDKRVTLVNSGVACWDIRKLLRVLPKIRPNNVKREYYLTDAVALLRAEGESVGIVTISDPDEALGINNRVELAKAEAVLRRRILEHWMREGVTIVDPATTYISVEAKIRADVRIWPGSIIQGASVIGAGCEIGPYSILEDAVMKDGTKAGPFARLRPGTVLEPGARVGNFVEVKKSRIGRGTKVNHLTYIGDATLGSGVNVGAGTITCNYDGFRKHQTLVGDRVFIGSNTNLVAPVRVGHDAIIAAGSTVTEDVNANALALARARQEHKPGWAKSYRNRQKRVNHE